LRRKWRRHDSGWGALASRSRRRPADAERPFQLMASFQQRIH
jgi:hypothetical protein